MEQHLADFSKLTILKLIYKSDPPSSY